VHGDALNKTASLHLVKLLALIRAHGAEQAPTAIFILSKSGVIETIPVPQDGFLREDSARGSKFFVLFCEGDFELVPPTRYFIEQLRSLFRALAVVQPLSPSTVCSIVNEGGDQWLIGEVGDHPLYLIEHIHTLCAEPTTYFDSLSSDGWYSASFQEFRMCSLPEGKTLITGWVQNTGVHSWKCGSALGTVRLGLLESDEESISTELRFDFERATIYPGEGSYFEFELKKPWELIEIDCVVEGKFWFGKSNLRSQTLRVTKYHNENIIECVANKDVVLIPRTFPSEPILEEIALLQRECKHRGIELHYDANTPTCSSKCDLIYVDFERISPNAESIMALRKSAYEFSDVRATAPLFFDVPLSVFLYGSKKTSSHFEQVLWSRTFGGIRKRAIHAVPAGCVYLRNVTAEDLEGIKGSNMESIPLRSPILVSTSITLELLLGSTPRARADRMLFSERSPLS